MEKTAIDLIESCLENFKAPDNEKKVTVLHRPGCPWRDCEIQTIANALRTIVSRKGPHDEYAALLGHFTKRAVLDALGGSQTFTARQVIGTNNTHLPFPADFDW